MRAYLDDVFYNSSPLFISRPKGRNLVVMSQEDYVSIMETFHLVKSPKNSERLQSALEEYKQGKGKTHNLIEG